MINNVIYLFIMQSSHYGFLNEILTSMGGLKEVLYEKITFLIGYGDTSMRDSLHIAEMVKMMKQLEYMNSFLILFNSQAPRLDEPLRAMIDIFTEIFGADRFYNNVILGFTRWSHSKYAERQRQRSGNFYKTSYTCVYLCVTFEKNLWGILCGVFKE